MGQEMDAWKVKIQRIARWQYWYILYVTSWWKIWNTCAAAVALQRCEPIAKYVFHVIARHWAAKQLQFVKTAYWAYGLISIYWHHLAQNIPYESKIFFIQYYLLFIGIIHGSHPSNFFLDLTRSRII